jgi:hypothetical protein
MGMVWKASKCPFHIVSEVTPSMYSEDIVLFGTAGNAMVVNNATYQYQSNINSSWTQVISNASLGFVSFSSDGNVACSLWKYDTHVQEEW